MLRVARFAVLSSALFVFGSAHAQTRDASAPSSSSAPATPLASALDALRTSDYPRAERELAAIRGADQAAAQMALARVMFETGRFAEADKIAQQQSGGARKLAALALRAEILF